MLPLLGVLVGASGLVGCLLLVTSSQRQHETAVGLAQLQADVLSLSAIQNAVEADEGNADLPRLFHVEGHIRTHLRDVVPRLPTGEAGALAAETQAYITAVDTIVTGFLSIDADLDDLAHYDDRVAEPTLASLNSRLERLESQADTAARRSAERAVQGLVLILVVMGVATAAVFAFDARAQRRAGARRTAERMDARFRAIVENLREYVLVAHDDGRISYASPNVEVTRPPGHDTLHIGDVRRGLSLESQVAISDVLRAAPTEPMQLQVTDAAGAEQHFEIVVSDQRANPHVAGMVITARDVTTQVQLEQRLRQQAATDELTGLPNRRALNEASADAFGRASRHDARIGLMIIDVDGFKGVNDALGHLAGDQLLVQVAARLRRACRSGEVVARLGGDEFAVLLEDVGTAAQATAAARRVREVIDEPYELGEHLVAVHASFGVAVAEPVEGFDDLFRHADVALYEAKERGRDQVVTFVPGMDGAQQTELRLRREMVEGFASGEFAMVYQPMIDLRSGRPIGLEALMRWNSATLGPVPPGEFIPVAERCGMITTLGRWALRMACAQLVAWQREHAVEGLSMSVNISVAQLQDDRFLDDVGGVLAETGITPSCLVLEVTESMLSRRPDAIAALLGQVRDLGVRVALDDFGSGYSSMAQLHRLPVDEIKIDRGFVQALGDGTAASRSVAGTMFALGRSMGLRTVAEGVEDPAQLAALRAQHCDVAQGFLFARPMPPAEVPGFLRERVAAADARGPVGDAAGPVAGPVADGAAAHTRPPALEA